VAPNRFGQRHWIEWLDDYSGSAERLEVLDLASLRASRHEDDGSVDGLRALAQLRKHRGPVHDRHQDIAEDVKWRFRLSAYLQLVS